MATRRAGSSTVPPIQGGEVRQAAVVARHSYGPRPLAAMLPGLMRPSFDRHGAATAQIMLDWPLIVGPALAGATRPRKFAGGTLTVACDGPAAMELQHGSESVVARINGHCGHALVQRLRLVQEPLGVATAVAGPVVVTPAMRVAAERAVGDFPAGELRDALAGLRLAMLQR